MLLFRWHNLARLCLASSLMAVLLPPALELSAKTVNDLQEMEILAVGGGDEGYSYFLYLDRDRNKCIDAFPSSAKMKALLDKVIQRYPPVDLRVKVRVERIKGFPATIRFMGEQLIISSAGGIHRNGRQIFLNCQDFLSNEPYKIYFVEEAKTD